MLVRLLRYHFEEERLRTKPAALHQKRSCFYCIMFLLLLTSPPSGSTIRSNHSSKEGALVSEV